MLPPTEAERSQTLLGRPTRSVLEGVRCAPLEKRSNEGRGRSPHHQKCLTPASNGMAPKRILKSFPQARHSTSRFGRLPAFSRYLKREAFIPRPRLPEVGAAALSTCCWPGEIETRALSTIPEPSVRSTPCLPVRLALLDTFGGHGEVIPHPRNRFRVRIIAPMIHELGGLG